MAGRQRSTGVATAVRRSVATVAIGVAAASLLLAGGCTPGGDAGPPVPSPTGAWAPPQHWITVEDGRFVDRRTGEVFVPRGVNYFNLVPVPGGWYEDRFFSPAVFDREQIAADFAALAARGYNTVRLFLDSCGSGPDCVGNEHGAGLNEAYLDVIAEVIALAAEHDLVLLLTSNDLPDQGGYWALVDTATSEDFPGYRNSHVLTPQGHAATARYWDDLMSGLAQRQARFEAVLGWSLLNEQWLFPDQPPLSRPSGVVETATGSYDIAQAQARRAMVVDNLRALIAGAATVIRSHDPDGLVTMGFFAPQFPHPTEIGHAWYVDTAPLVAESDLDFFDFHAYPGEDIGLPEITENFGLDERKPVVMGEVGAFLDRYPTVEAAGIAVQQWMAQSCDLGYDGWLYWAYLRSPLSDGTWALTDDGDYLLQALAPVNQPDPCAPTLVKANLALGAAVTASGSLPAEQPQLAVDGNPGTWWGAGAEAPQWIELDLGEPVEIAGVRLVVSQHPAGRTVHRVEVAGADRVFRLLTEMAGDTVDGDVLQVEMSAAAVRFVRVTTLASPSWVGWREIEVPAL